MNESEDIRGLLVALGQYVIVFALKLVAYFVTGVMALLAEALHTLSDIFVSSFLLVAALWSRRKADERYMFGYGRAQYVGALVAAVLFISFTSFELYQEAIPRLFERAESAYQSLELAIGVVVVSMVFAAVPLVTLARQKTRGAAAKAQMLESINDELGLLAALIGTLFIAWGQPIADPIASLIVATIIAYNGVRLFLENLALLVGRAPDEKYLAEIKARALSVPGVLGVHDLRAEYIGPGIVHAGMHIVVARGTPIEEANKISKQVHQRVHADSPSGYCVIHVDPAEPTDDQPTTS